MTGDHALSLKYALKKMSRFVKKLFRIKKSMDQTQSSSRWFRLLKLDLYGYLTLPYIPSINAKLFQLSTGLQLEPEARMR